MNTYLIFLFLIFVSKTYSSVIIPSAHKFTPEEITKILNDTETTSDGNRWGYILNRNILLDVDKHRALYTYIGIEDDSDITQFNVLATLQKYNEDGDRNDEVRLDVARGLIKDAIACTGLTKTNLFTLLVINDLMTHLKRLVDTNNPTATSGNAVCCDNVYGEHRLNFNIKSEKNKIELRGMGKSGETKILQADPAWQNFIRNVAAVDIDYRINVSAFNSYLNPLGTAIAPSVVDMYEIVYILVNAFTTTEEKLAKTCVAHHNKYGKAYESLAEELGEEFVKFTKDLDENEDSNLDADVDKLYDMLLFFTPENIHRDAPYALRQVHFTDGNTMVAMELCDQDEEEENSLLANTTFRKLSFTTSFENESDGDDSGDEDSDKEEHKKAPVYYHFKDTINVILSKNE
ncbi:uncharacterized protein LOC126837344 [Adelges cooleyi]|uniref:uncharacterized protein LOC126837344 n=1 Tax=Adelges cooleyi TaxID=133065 RepID=UPI00218042ED|nr:uncharacterized protein LOC126837344 [Adelges cooleyi]